MMHGHEKSDHAIVAVKPATKAEQPTCGSNGGEPTAAEPVERRAGTKGNASQQSTHRTQSRASVSQALERIRQAITVWTRGRSRMRASRTYGSVRGALSNERPYRYIRLPPSPVSVPSMEVAIRLPRWVVVISRSVSRCRRMAGKVA